MFKIDSYLGAVLHSGGTVVVPSRQRAHALRLAYAAAQLAQGRIVWRSPDVLPLQGWLTREVEKRAAENASRIDLRGAASNEAVPRLLSPAEEWLIWRQCTLEAAADLELVNRAALAESLRQAGTLAGELGVDPGAIGEFPGTEAALLASVHRAVAERCRERGAAPLPAAVASLRFVGDERPVVFAGFLARSPLLQSIIDARARHGCESGYAPAPDPAALAAPQVLRPADERDELERIAEWCHERVSAQPDVRLLVLLPGAAGRRERLASLIRQSIDPHAALQAPGDTQALVALEGGQSLASLPLVSHALVTLQLLAGEALETEGILEWLRAPWWREPSAPARARLDHWLRERGRLQFDLVSLLETLRRAPSAMAAEASRILARLEDAADAVHASSATPREWSERFKAALDASGWPGAGTQGSAEQQTLVRFHELLDELGQLNGAVRTLTGEVAIRWLTELAARTSYRPADDDAVITISSAYADPVVRYDGLWVAGLNADAFPQPVAPDPFLPLAAQLAAGSPAASAAGRLEEARTLITAWRGAAAELVLSAPARAEDVELLPSPLIEAWAPAEESCARASGSMWLPVRLHRPGLLSEWRDDAGVAWDPRLPLPSGTRSLELQNQCPFRAYAELRLGSQEFDAPEPGIAPDERGQLLHGALQLLWDRLGDSRALTALTAQALDEMLGACIEEAASALEEAGGERLARPALARECRRIARLVRKLLDIERRRAPFRVEHTEYSMRLRLAGQELRLRIDRLDALESGGLAILDYKSGRRVSADWYGDRPSHPQLLAYLAAVGEEVVAMATVNVTAREVRFDGIAASEELLPKVSGVKAAEAQGRDAWSLRVREWRGVVERLAAAFAAGHAAVDPKPRACEFCHVASVCRVGDSLIIREDDGPEEGARGRNDD